MDNEPALGEEEAIRLCLKGCVDHFLLLFFGQVWQFINVLPSINAVRHAEWEVEFELGEYLTAEEMLFDKSQLLKWLIAVNIGELQVQFKISQLEESAGEFVF